MRIRTTLAAFASAGLLAGALTGLTATPASADSGMSWKTYTYSNGDVRIVAKARGKVHGYVEWNADGDKLCASDQFSNSEGIRGELSTGRTATSKSPGHDSCKGGNLPEGTAYTMRACIVGPLGSDCSSRVRIRA
ncbi:hypothetical protein OHS81_17065 [Streptomyces sp. NBC_00400]|uniref:hypothetical protein n=1 Tax=Streptomyces sp. NBC_00400 TaxID=2975737 RepID=UPI002E1C33B7